MKKISFFFITTFGVAQVFSQSISESKDNVNSILLNGSAITLKVTDPSIKIDFQRNNLFKDNRNSGYIIGGSAEGKNNSGTASLFNGGDFLPSGNISGILGLTFSNNTVSNFQIEIEELRDKQKLIRKKIDDLREIRNQYSLSNNPDTVKLDSNINSIIKNDLTPLLTQESGILINYTEKSFWKVSLFAYGGISAKSFKHFISYDATDLLKSFKTENFRGGFFSFGVNSQYRNWQFGTTFGQRWDDNQAMMSEKSYNYERITSSNGQTIKEAKEIKAFVGEYINVSYYSLNVDLIGNFSLDKVNSNEQARNYILLNPYLHSKIGSSNKDFYPNTTNIGVGVYAFNSKSKILGGIYLELPDIENKIEKSKNASDQHLRSAFQRLSIGIVTRFNLQSFMKF